MSPAYYGPPTCLASVHDALLPMGSGAAWDYDPKIADTWAAREP